MTTPGSSEIYRARRFDLIAFDWDGTLSDSTAVIVKCIQAAVADVGGTPPSNEAASYVCLLYTSPSPRD